ncbi:hypothetical protein LINPERPRIM_LOCUS24100, partial [Linum perenne]
MLCTKTWVHDELRIDSMIPANASFSRVVSRRFLLVWMR